jgi:hypothetical protein
MFLWLIVIANFTKALVAFHDGRIATEGTVMVNALICTVLILGFARQQDETPPVREADYGRLTRRAALLGPILLVAIATFYTTGVRALYGNQWTGWGGNNLRFGDKADWRVKPILKSKQHN